MMLTISILHNAITWVRNVGKAVEWRAVLCCIDGRIDELNLHLKRDIHIM